MNPAGELASPGLRLGAFDTLPSLVLRLAPTPILKVVLGFVMLASFLMFAVDDENRQNWYDRLLGTFVVQKPQES